MRGEGLLARADHQVLALLARLEAREGGAPPAVVAGGGGRLDGAELHADLRARMGLAEDGGVAGLQHGVVREKGHQLEFSGGDQGGKAEQQGGEAGVHASRQSKSRTLPSAKDPDA